MQFTLFNLSILLHFKTKNYIYTFKTKCIYELEIYTSAQKHAIITLCVGHYTRAVNLRISGIHSHILQRSMLHPFCIKVLKDVIVPIFLSSLLNFDHNCDPRNRRECLHKQQY